MQTLGIIHGVYYILTGLWPLLHSRSFQYVTGPKKEMWLVNTAGGLIAIIGMSILASIGQTNLGRGIFVLLIGAPLILATVDIYYSARGTIRRIYLMDALAELLIVAGWLTVLVVD